MKRICLFLLSILIAGSALICFNLTGGILSNPFTILESLTSDTLLDGGFGYTNSCPSSYYWSQPQASGLWRFRYSTWML